MNFVHRILKSSGGSSSSSSTESIQKLVQNELQHAKLIYLGEFHSEKRIISFQLNLVKELMRCLAAAVAATKRTAAPTTTLHLIMEHFSVDMQPILDRYQQTNQQQQSKTIINSHHNDDDEEEENKAFEELVTSYNEEYGTEGHNLHPYRELLQFCRRQSGTTVNNNNINNHQDNNNNNNNNNNSHCKVKLHGGFIPRNQAAKLNKETFTTTNKKREFFHELSSRGYLPHEHEPMYRALFDTTTTTTTDNDEFTLRGTREHKLLIQSLMSGIDIYSPAEEDDEDEVDKKEEERDDTNDKMSRLYQAQLLKDHAMGYKIASLMMEHATSATSTATAASGGSGKANNDDRYLVITGLGHLKHYTGVPDCVNGYLRQEVLSNSSTFERRSIALDLLQSVTCPPIHSLSGRSRSGGNGCALIGCQMMYEIYLEEIYPPMIEATSQNEDGEIEDDVKRTLLNNLYLQNPTLLDQYIWNSDVVRGPLLGYADGLARFQKPCADYLFVYDEDDDNEIDDDEMVDVVAQESTIISGTGQCPFHEKSKEEDENDDDAGVTKAETIQAYEQVGKTAGLRGNVARAKAIMTYLGYSNSDIEYLGEDDIYNFQGVANPHHVAKIRHGETVLDIGSGLGIDSFLAVRDCGADDVSKGGNESCDKAKSFVVGVDIAQSEVNHAMTRAIDRGLVVPDRIRFIRGDVEKLSDALEKASLATESIFDVVISNGAFCLVPDKRKAFEEVFRALRPGGRMAISTTTVSSPKRLDPSFEWPICLKMFANLDEIQPMCELIGFKNVQVIDADSPLEGMELPDDDVEVSKSDDRYKIHGKYADQYEFLQSMDMDELCKVVTVYGEKP